MIRAGDLNRKFTLQTPTRDQLANGEDAGTFRDAGIVWVKLTPATPREAAAAGQQAASVTHTITARYVDANHVTTDDQLAYKGRTFRILGIVDVDDRREELRIVAEERKP